MVLKMNHWNDTFKVWFENESFAIINLTSNRARKINKLKVVREVNKLKAKREINKLKAVRENKQFKSELRNKQIKGSARK